MSQPLVYLDGITVELLRANKHILASPLKHLINRSFSNAIVPDLFKLSIVTPIFKRRNKFNQ